MSCISDAVRIVSESWRPIQEAGKDYNIADIFDLASTVQSVCSLVFGESSNNFSKEDVRRILVELIERELHPSTDPIRSRSSVQLTEDLGRIGVKVLEVHPEFGSIEEAIMKSLFIWVGCLQIDRACRKEDALGKPFDRSYSLTIQQELVSLSNTNPWIKLGFSSAKYFRQHDNQNKFYNWIPKDSLLIGNELSNAVLFERVEPALFNSVLMK